MVNKVSDKIKIIENILSEVDQLLIGGTWLILLQAGIKVGKSLCAEEDVKLAQVFYSSQLDRKLFTTKRPHCQ